MTFAELVALMVLGSGELDTISGVVRHHSPEDEDWTHRVWRRGDLARVEALDGQVLRIVGADQEWVRYRGDEGFTALRRGRTWGSPIGGLEPGGDRGSFSRWDGTDFTRATGPVATTTYLDRDCWQVELAPPGHKPYPIQVTVDAATGLVLRTANHQFGSVTEFISVEIGAELDDDLFSWPGPARPYADVRAERDIEHEQDMAERGAWLDAHGVALDLPVRPQLMLHERDDDTGAFQASIDLHASGHLVRRPLGDPAAPDDVRYPKVYRWEDARWEWLLGIGQPIADEQLALLKARLADST